MKLLKKISITTFSVLIGLSAFAQDVLTVEEAVAIALENNYSIKLVEKNVEIAERNNTIYNAGFLPSIIATAGQDAAWNNIYQERYTGETVEENWANSSAFRSGVALDWTVFQGFNMVIAKNTLEELQAQEELQARLTIENTVSAVIVTYYNLVSEKMRSNVLLDALQLSRERKELALFKMDIGSAAQADVYQATVDYNADTAAYIQQMATITSIKSNMNNLLGREVETPFEVVDSLAINNILDIETILEKVRSQNTQLSLARQNIELAELNVRYWKSQFFPAISLYGGYDFLRSQSEVGFTERNVNHGPVVGVRGTFSIFNGFNTRRNYAISKIQEEQSELQRSQTALDVSNSVYNLFVSYKASLQLANLEATNLEAAEENLDIAVEKYELGTINNIELRDTQLKYIDAQNRYVQAFYQAKEAETELLRLAGEIL